MRNFRKVVENDQIVSKKFVNKIFVLFLKRNFLKFVFIPIISRFKIVQIFKNKKKLKYLLVIEIKKVFPICSHNHKKSIK